MNDLLDQATSWLDAQRAEHLSRLVTYVRGDQSVALPATMGNTTYEVQDDTGATAEAKATDFLISADQLVLGSEITLPVPGDRIRVTRGETVEVFEVMALGGAGHYRPCDPFGRLLRVHTKQVATE